MRSYDSATLVKTPATRCVFSASVTVSKPKWVVFSPAAAGGGRVAVDERETAPVEKGRGPASARQGRIDADHDHHRRAGLLAAILRSRRPRDAGGEKAYV